MEALTGMREPVLVRSDTPVDIARDDLDNLIEKLRSEGLDARPARIEGEGFGIDPWWVIVSLWIGREAGRAGIDQLVGLAVEWAKERFRRSQEETSRSNNRLRGLPESSQRQKGVRLTIIRYEGNEGHAVEIVELEAEDANPLRRLPEGFERNTRFRPLERDARAPAAPPEDIEQELPTLILPSIAGNEEDLLRENRERLYRKGREYPRDAVLDAWLLIEAEAHAAAIRNNINLSLGITHILRTIEDRQQIPEFVVEAAHTLRDIRSRVAPRPIPGLSTHEARVYVDTVVRVIAYLARA